MEEREAKKERRDFEVLLRQAVEQKFIRVFVEDMPQALECIRRLEKEIESLKGRMKESLEEIDKLKAKMEKEGCDPVRQHLKMHSFVNWFMTAVVPMAVTAILWLLGYIR